ncbi:MAG: endolytic transglycosylase MltG [Clostridia bacterium]|nr:endolytic transglycosylase MltG [Clostridia bacterium]
MGKRGKQSNTKKIVLLSVLAGILLLLIAVAVTVLVIYNEFRNDVEGNDTDTNLVTIEIERGDSTKKIAEKLEEKGIVDYPFWFVHMARQQNVDNKLQIGTYEFSSGDSYQEILNILKQAPNYRPAMRIYFPEGAEVTDIIDKLLSEGAKNGAKWTKAGFDAALLADYDCAYLPAVNALPEGCPVYARLEGFLYPDTYDFFLDSTEEQIFAKMIDQFNKKVAATGLAEKAQAHGFTVYEAMILGSIIQKESGNVADFALISSVFNNRLDINMKLQSDATVSYMIPKEERLPSCTSAQLNKDTPYNVYIRNGLCPTPICCPRIEAAVAACQPEQSDYYYFIGVPNDSPTPEAGKTLFSKNYQEHMQKVNKYLR